MKKRSSDDRVRFDSNSSGGSSLTVSKSALNSNVLYSDVKTVRIDSNPDDEPSVFKREEATKSVEIEDFPNVRNSLDEMVASGTST